jgi:hypothetical protein
VGCCEHGNAPLDSIKDREFLVYLSDLAAQGFFSMELVILYLPDRQTPPSRKKINEHSTNMPHNVFCSDEKV